MNSTVEHWLIVGCGYTGGVLAQDIQSPPPGSTNSMQPAVRLTALTRSTDRQAELRSQGIEPVIGHWLDLETLSNVPAVDRILVAVPHREDGTPGRGNLEDQTHVQGLRNLLQVIPEGWQKLVYLSTTGVYGSVADQTVTEDSPVCPNRIGPRIALAAEEYLQQTIASDRLTILRLAGIYGPGRIPLAAKLLAGEPLAVPQEGCLNLAHVSDIARAIRSVAQRRMEHVLYLFSDGHPVPRREFYTYLAEQCGAATPVFSTPDPHSSRAQRSGSKRVDPGRLVGELNFEYRFPDYRSGLAAIFADG